MRVRADALGGTEDWQTSVARDYAEHLCAAERARMRCTHIWFSCHMPGALPPTRLELDTLRILRLAELVEAQG